MVRNPRSGPGVIVEQQGPLSYLVETSDRFVWKRHADYLKELGELTSADSITKQPKHHMLRLLTKHKSLAPPPALVTDSRSPDDTTEPAAMDNKPVDEASITSETAPETVNTEPSGI